MTGYGEKLKKYLQRKDINQIEFAELINVDGSTVNKYINGSRYPCPEVMKKIVGVIGAEEAKNIFLSIN